ncbi:DUF917 domain-containing protein [Arsenophonus sp. ENCA]|uniref:DUF917 domain-containing protein n=1 Tax=Arsenophonus sp. ENCA TaxID=1987579 RepID=UPI0025C6A814|nr:DUF917 domain-containing protein [Arsenophonus sp. ENCA]
MRNSCMYDQGFTLLHFVWELALELFVFLYHDSLCYLYLFKRKTVTLLDVETIEQISYGASVLASGGGGDPYIGKIMAQQAIEKHGLIRLISINELHPNDMLLSTGMTGSPAVMIEKLPNGKESILACRRVEESLKKKITAIYPIEAGGINSLLPLTTACRLGLPVVDVDGMGRAFPQFHITTFYLDNINASPFVVIDLLLSMKNLMQ